MAIIEIINGKRNGKLVLSDGGDTKAVKNEHIVWVVRSESNVASIDAINLKENSRDVFSDLPNGNGTVWMGRIKSNAPDSAVCFYEIRWTGKPNSDVPGSHLYDPKISIKPSAFADRIFKLILLVVSAALGIFTLNFLRKKKILK